MRGEGAFNMYMIYFYVPESHLEIVKEAIFKAGAGNIGNYNHCAWQTLGESQFMPLKGSDAFIGEVGKLEKMAEYKVEVVCENTKIKLVIDALKKSHPYETPAYQVMELADV